MTLQSDSWNGHQRDPQTLPLSGTYAQAMQSCGQNFTNDTAGVVRAALHRQRRLQTSCCSVRNPQVHNTAISGMDGPQRNLKFFNTPVKGKSVTILRISGVTVRSCHIVHIVRTCVSLRLLQEPSHMLVSLPWTQCLHTLRNADLTEMATSETSWSFAYDQ
jgi:hypothetical protein